MSGKIGINKKCLFIAIWWLTLDLICYAIFRSYILFLIAILIILVGIADYFIIKILEKNFNITLNCNRQRSSINSNIELYINYKSIVIPAFLDMEIYVDNMFLGGLEVLSVKEWVSKCDNVIYDFSSEHMGYISISANNCELYNFSHIFYIKYENIRSAGCMIFPEEQDTEVSVYDMVAGLSKDNLFANKGVEYSSDYEIREYVPGDEMKNIHWKLSAKASKLMVMERGGETHEQLNVVLEFCDDKNDNDVIISNLYTFGKAALADNYDMTLFYIEGNSETLSKKYISEYSNLYEAVYNILSTSCISSIKTSELYETEYSNRSYILIDRENGGVINNV